MAEDPGDRMQDLLRALQAPCMDGAGKDRPCTACLDARVLLTRFFDAGGDPLDILPTLRQRALWGIGPEGKNASDCILAGNHRSPTSKP